MHLSSSVAVALLASSVHGLNFGNINVNGFAKTTPSAKVAAGKAGIPTGFGGTVGGGRTQGAGTPKATIPAIPANGGQKGTPVKGGGSPAKSTAAAATHPAAGGGNIGIGAGGGGCPSVWTQISSDLTALFVSGGQCTDDARAAIRATFHDCFPSGGCDGSLSIAAELSRPENSPMTSTVNKLKSLAQQRGVTVADMLVFAGSHAVASCPGGPRVETFIGRKDATSPAPSGQLPSPSEAASSSIAKFSAKGLDTTDLAALIGAHSTSKQFTVDPSKAGTPEDSTPGVWDTLYYQQTIAGTAPFTFVSDSNLVKQAQTGPIMKQFANDKSGWDAAFASAMAKMELLGGNKGSMVDCTNALPNTLSAREAKARPINARA